MAQSRTFLSGVGNEGKENLKVSEPSATLDRLKYLSSHDRAKVRVQFAVIIPNLVKAPLHSADVISAFPLLSVARVPDPTPEGFSTLRPPPLLPPRQKPPDRVAA